MGKENLDETDKKILFELDKNARQTLSQIGKRLRLSKQVVDYRIKNLEKNGLIKGYFSVLDIGKLGFLDFRIFLKFYNTTPEKEREIIEYLKNNPRVGWLVSVDGYWSTNMLVWAKSMIDLQDNFWKGFMDRYRNYIDNKWISVITHLVHYRKNFLVPDSKNLDFEISGGEIKKDVDEKDEKILDLLSGNARMPLVEIGKKVGLSTNIVAYRIKQMKKRNVILGFRPLLDLEKLGVQYHKVHFYLKNTKPETEKQLLEYSKRHPNIILVDITVGGADFEIEIYAKNSSEFHSILDDIKTRFSEVIKNYETMVYCKEYKWIYMPVKI